MTRSAPRTLAISQRRAAAASGAEDGRAASAGDDLPGWATAAAAAGVDAIQLREKDLAAGPLFDLARRLVELLPATVALLVNGRADVAVGCGAAGVHLPAAGVPLARLRRRFPALLIGASTHHLDEVAAARDGGADYVTFGPVWAPTSKRSPLPPVGLEGLARAASLGIPVLALGGITVERLPDVAATGAAGAAAIGAFQPPLEPRLWVAAAHRLFARPLPGGALAP